MASLVAAEEREMFVCPVCRQDVFDLKVVGLCLHSACRGCVLKQINGQATFVCPDCKTVYDVPVSGVDGLNNFSSMMNIMARYSKKPEAPAPPVTRPAPTLMKMVDLSFPDQRPCRWIFNSHFLPGGRIVTLAESTVTSSGADTLYLHEPASSTASRVLVNDIAPATTMNVTSTGDVLVFTRGAELAGTQGQGDETTPLVRIFNVDSGAFMNIAINVSDTGIDKVSAIETDEQGYIFLMHGDYRNRRVLVFGRMGNICQNVSLGDAWGMAFCKRSNILYVVTQDKIRRYRWNILTTGLAELSSSCHGLQSFYCWDVCVGSTGRIFVAGMMQNNKEVKVFEVSGELTGDKDIHLCALKFYDEKPRMMCCYSPRIAVQKNQLLLVYCDDFQEKWRVEVFTGVIG